MMTNSWVLLYLTCKCFASTIFESFRILMDLSEVVLCPQKFPRLAFWVYHYFIAGRTNDMDLHCSKSKYTASAPSVIIRCRTDGGEGLKYSFCLLDGIILNFKICKSFFRPLSSHAHFAFVLLATLYQLQHLFFFFFCC